MNDILGDGEDSVGIVVPLYKPDIDVTVEYLEELRKNLRPESLIVSVDSPSERLLSRLPDDVVIEASRRRRGKGRAIEDGFRRLDTDYMMFVDGDGSVPIESVKKIIEEGSSSLVIGTRRHDVSLDVSHDSNAEKWMGDVLVLLAQKIIRTDIRDFQCGAKMFKRDVWKEVENSIESTGFEWDLEVIYEYEKRNIAIQEIPISWKDKPNSKVSIVRDVPIFLKLLLSIIVEKFQLKTSSV